MRNALNKPVSFYSLNSFLMQRDPHKTWKETRRAPADTKIGHFAICLPQGQSVTAAGSVYSGHRMVPSMQLRTGTQ